MKAIFTSIALSLLALPTVVAQNTVTIDASSEWIGFMAVFNLDSTTNFLSGWALGDLQSSVDMEANTLSLQPNFNTYNAADPFWTDPVTLEGAKIMEANTFVEPGASFNGADFTFNGAVQSYTLDTSYTVKYFVKALNPDDNFADVLGGGYIFDLPESGTFSTTVPAAEIPAGLLLQYGFSVTGRNANPADEATLGSVVLAAFTTSVDELSYLERQIAVFPNPADDLLNINSEAPVKSFEVSTMMGQRVLSGVGTNQVDISALPTGNYLITVNIEEGRRAMRFVKR
ncbi:MAG: T9SS type A sorting domain-containing protein [Bacteroidota bacterium]